MCATFVVVTESIVKSSTIQELEQSSIKQTRDKYTQSRDLYTDR